MFYFESTEVYSLGTSLHTWKLDFLSLGWGSLCAAQRENRTSSRLFLCYTKTALKRCLRPPFVFISPAISRHTVQAFLREIYPDRRAKANESSILLEVIHPGCCPSPYVLYSSMLPHQCSLFSVLANKNPLEKECCQTQLLSACLLQTKMPTNHLFWYISCGVSIKAAKQRFVYGTEQV